jgi:hypothetical protein
MLVASFTALGGLVVVRLNLDSRVMDSIPTGGYGFLWALKSLSTPSFGGEVKQLVPRHRFKACKKNPTSVEMLHRQN